MEKDAVVDLVRRMKPRDHVIMFYEHLEDKHRVLLTYLKTGLDSQEAVVYVAGIDETPTQIKNLINAFGIEVDECEKKGMLRIMSYKDWYMINGEFNTQRTIKLWADLLNRALAEGFKGLRVMGDATFFFECNMKEALLHYENSLHKVLDMPLIAICAYSLPVLMQQNETQLVGDLIKAHNNVIFLGSQAGLVKTEEINSVSH